MTRFISNPFQVLGVSAPLEPLAVSPQASAAPSIAEKKSEDSVASSPHSLTFLHALGDFLFWTEKNLLPLAVQIALPILEKRL